MDNRDYKAMNANLFINLKTKKMEDKIIRDEKNYFEMSKPHENADIANKALHDFYAEISELRKKYKIRDVLVITYDSVQYPDNKIGEFMQHTAFGNSTNQVNMAAYVYGQVNAEERERVNKLLAGTTNL